MKKYILIIFSIGILVILAGCTVKTSDNATQEQPVKITEAFSFTETEYDFGVIQQSGGKVLHDFSFVYNGAQPIEITGVPTSCACTSATVNKTKFKQGESGILTVKFNPNLHAEPKGKFFKSISFLTEPKLPEMPEVKIWVEIDLDLGPEAFELKSDHDEEEEEEGLSSYTSVTAEKFAKMLKNKDFFLLDVHIPEQKHISETDELIPYNEIEENLSKLPADKDAKIVVYCRSGGMSRAAAYILAEHGYTNVFDLAGGKNAFDKYLQN